MDKAKTYQWLLEHCRDNLEKQQAKAEYLKNIGCLVPAAEKRARIWQACVDLLEEECPFHLSMLEGRE